MKILLNEKVYLPIVYIIIGIILFGILKRIVDKTIKSKKIDNRKMTIISLVNNIIKYIIFIFMILSILKVYGVDTSGILASIGIVGLVIGLAIQDIIADFLKGVLIIFDNQYTIGDFVEINGFRGEVISLGLMNTKIKGINGEIKIISNSSFKEVTNYSIKNTTLLINLDVAYGTDIDKLESILKGIENEVLNISNVKGNYSLLGISEFSSSSIKYLVSLDTLPNRHYQIRRDYLKIIYREFNKNGIEIPYNKLDVNIKK